MAVEESAEDLFEDAPCGYLSTALDGTILRANRTFLRLTGLERDDLVGRRRFQDLLTVGGRIYHETHVGPLLRMQGSVREIAVELVGAGGRRVPVLVSSRVHHDEGGAPVTVRTAVFEAAERREYERELMRARQRAEASEERARVLARTLQQSLVPPDPPAVPGLDLAGAYRPAGDGDEVGGDFYDVFETTDGAWAVVIGDVCGKGAEAAAVTALARYTLRAAAMQQHRPSDVLARLNEAILRQRTERFCTVVYAVVRPSGAGSFRLTLASGGHPLPLLAAAGRPPVPVGRPGTLLGVFEEPRLADDDVALGPGDVVVLCTDGVVEGRRGGEFFGEARLLAAVEASRSGTAAGVADRIVGEVVAFQDGCPRDDIAVVVLKVPAGA